MELDGYELDRAFDRFDYAFYSEGPKGRIRKIIKFRQVRQFGENIFNLAFGDLDEATGKLNDQVISNNDDRLKILNTVAAAIVDFMKHNPNAFILVKGSSMSRTRLYQMMVNAFWPVINQQFEIYGKTNKEWQPFQKGVNYEEFLLFRKNE